VALYLLPSKTMSAKTIKVSEAPAATIEPEEFDPVAAEQASPPPAVTAVSPNGQSPPDDGWFDLTNPIFIGGGSAQRTLTRLRIDSRDLDGIYFFQIDDEFREKYPDKYRTAINKVGELEVQKLVLCALNKIAPEDLFKIPFNELGLVFLNLARFLYLRPRKKT
jgi:hypothetical protein